MTSIFGGGLILYPLAFTLLRIRKIEWKEIGLCFKVFFKKNIIGIGVAIQYQRADQYVVDPISSKFAPLGFLKIFSIKVEVSKLI